MKPAVSPVDSAAGNRPWSVFLIFLRLGLTSFGGPVAHLGYFRDEFVVRRRWLSERSYADLVALCQFLPGPASSQVGLALGLSRAGYRGAFAAWAGFTLPSALILILFATSLAFQGSLHAGVLQGLKVVAVAVVAQAVWGMARTLCPDRLRVTLMAASAVLVLLLPFIWSQPLVLLGAGLLGVLLIKPTTEEQQDDLPVRVSRRAGSLALGLFLVLLVGLPLLASLFPSQLLSIVDSFYRVGALVFGGGHVMLPLLEAETVQAGLLDIDTFLAGYGATQAIPGPLFTFAAFLGTAINTGLPSWLTGLVCLAAIFLPSFLLVVGALPFWAQLRHSPRTQAALAGINAAVVGLLLAALYQPVWSSAIKSSQDFALGLAALIALVFWKLPPWLVVLATAALGWLAA
ncbi:chromate transporter [Pseudomonas saudimassiliensis]|uniref:Chromate transporter n=1 Tax=Pseudomonas saudimassiliensis TaxID=1461581 RepID=A0A078MLP2_9PSED|nr:chromate efflux transporter [Pseudomonas saudimassiliensis]CEA06362.1 chromate transporter [Pseudomonas saudimassiliensis]CEF27787.1 chromate transporter [Pseudomonas saudimassiliensis]